MTLVAALLLGAGNTGAQVETGAYSFRDPSLSPDARIRNLLALMTVDEKIDALSTSSGVPRLGIPDFGASEGIHGVVQRGNKEQNEAPIPTTQFPQPPGMGATWNPELVRQAGAVEGDEGRYITLNEKFHRPALMLWGPQADLARDPRWGRSEEVYSEDPFLTGSMATAFARGLQGDDPTYWRSAALLKHFLANSNENGRGGSSSNFDERLFWEYYAAPFQMSFADGGARALMASYNAWNGVPMGVHPSLKKIVIDQWGGEVISSDGGAISLLVKEHKRYPDQQQAVVAALKAGVNQFLDKYKDELRAALKDQQVSEAEIDEALQRKFRITMRLGLIDPPQRNPYANGGNGTQPWLSPRHKAVSLDLARQSIVLLKNEKRTLPLNAASIKSIAVLGPLADVVRNDWYGGIAPYAVTPLAGITAAAGAGVRINHAGLDDVAGALRAARDSDVAIVVVGNDPTCGPNMANEWTEDGTKPCADPGDGREGRDRVTLALKQEELVRQIHAVNPRTVMVLVSSFPYTINWSAKHLPAIVQMAHASQDQGTALAEVLFGQYNPGGKLTVTWPASEAQLPAMMDYNIRNGHTYMYFNGKPLFPFGYGLSFTRFKYANMRVPAQQAVQSQDFSVSVDVSNTGKLKGDTVVQLYASYPHAKVKMPRQALIGFQRVTLQAGETRTVKIPVKTRQLGYWNTGKQAFDIEQQTVKLMIATSSEEIQLTKDMALR